MNTNIDFQNTAYDKNYYQTHNIKVTETEAGKQLVSAESGGGGIPKLSQTTTREISKMLRHDLRAVLKTADSHSDVKDSIQKITNLVSNAKAFISVHRPKDRRQLEKLVDRGRAKLRELAEGRISGKTEVEEETEVEEKETEVEEKKTKIEEEPTPSKEVKKKKLSKQAQKEEEKYREQFEVAERTLREGIAQILRVFKEKGAQEGIFRKSSNESEKQNALKKIGKVKIDKNPEEIDRIIKETKDVHLIAGIMKELFRNLKPPLIDKNAESLFIESAKVDPSNKAGVIKKLNNALASMPKENRELLIAMAKVLKMLVDIHGDKTRMQADNLAIVWGPNLIETIDPITITSYQEAITALIEYANDVNL